MLVHQLPRSIKKELKKHTFLNIKNRKKEKVYHIEIDLIDYINRNYKKSMEYKSIYAKLIVILVNERRKFIDSGNT